MNPTEDSDELPRFTVVTPCYNEEETLPAYFEEVIPALDALTDGRWRLVLVDDGSRDRSLEIILAKHREEPRVTAVSLSRNFGHQAALTAGLQHADGLAIGIMDCDLQDPVSVLAELYRKVVDEGYDVCNGARAKRDASWFLRFAYRLFYRLISRVSDHDWPLDSGDFSVFNRRVHQTLLSLPERVRMLRGLRSWVGFRQTSVPYDRPARRHGVSKYNLIKLSGLALTAFVGFSSVPLRIASLLGFLMSFFTLLFGGFLLVNRFFPKFTLFGYYIGANTGITTLALYISFVSGMLFFCLGIIGEYVSLLVREVKARPTAIPAGLIGRPPRVPDGNRPSHPEPVRLPAA